jgi:dUTP pyrophosphatase
MILKIKALDFTIEPISYATEGSACLDLRASVATELKARHRAVVPCGIAIELPSGYEAQIRSRSGLAAKNGVAVLNAPGTIDEDYRGEIKVILFNYSDEDFMVTPNMRIAQMLIAPVTKVRLAWQDVELSQTQRGQGGFGSTGVH